MFDRSKLSLLSLASPDLREYHSSAWA
jgi:hypothetical protein